MRNYSLTMNDRSLTGSMEIRYDSEKSHVITLQAYRQGNNQTDTCLTMEFSEDDAKAALHFFQQFLLDCDRANRNLKGV